MKIEKVNIGEIIRRKIKTSESEFAKSIGLKRQNVAKTVFNKHSLDTDLLIRISEVLGHNFFEYYKCDEVCNKNDYVPKIKDVKTTVSFQIGDELKEYSFNSNQIIE